MYDPPLRRAMRVDPPAWLIRAGLHLALKTRARLLRWFGRPRATPLFADGIQTRTYPEGYDISRLGPPEPAAPPPPAD